MFNVAIDPQTHGYMVREYTIPDGVAHVLTPSPEFGWKVSKISMYAAAANPCVLRVLGIAGSLGALGVINIAAGGCIVLEPGGVYRGNVEVSGQDAKVIVEYWFPIRAGDPTTVSVTITP